MSAQAAQHPMMSSPPMRASPSFAPAPNRGFAFHHFHRPFFIVDSGFWWGYPYPYYYGYPVNVYGQSYEHVGKQWGKDLKHGKVTTAQFVTFLQLDVVRASDEARSHFQEGFLRGYGKNGLAFYTDALAQAKTEVAPSNAGTMPPPPADQPAQPPVEAPVVPPKSE